MALGAPAKLQAEAAVIVQALWLKAHNFPKENEWKWGMTCCYFFVSN